MEEKIVKVLNVMSEYLSIAQMKKLQEVILQTFAENEVEKSEIPNDKFLEMFLDAKSIEGCSERTIKYYRETVRHLFVGAGVSSSFPVIALRRSVIRLITFSKIKITSAVIRKLIIAVIKLP